MKVCSCSPQRQNKSILSFLAPPYQPASAKAMLDNYPGKSAAVRLSCSLPDYRHYSPPPINCPDRFVPPGLLSGSATSAVINGAGPDGCLPELDMFPPVAKLCVYGICAFVLRCFFLFSHCTPQWRIVWGLKKKFSSLSSCNAVIFFNSLSYCPVYPLVCMLCMGRLMAYFTGTCD